MTSEDPEVGGESPRQEGDGQSTVHVPVLLPETLTCLDLADGLCVVDGTVGAGGHSQAILQAISPEGRLIGLDQDEEILARAKAVLSSTVDARARFTLFPISFARMREALDAASESSCDRVLLDLGVSSMQIDTPERGFSFQSDGPLDMRMNRAHGRSLVERLRKVSEEELARVIYEYGEERHSRRIARAIVEARSRGGLHRTLQLAEIIQKAVNRAGRPGGRGRRQSFRIHPATRTFMALRIWVNDELDELRRGLQAALDCLSPGGRLAVIAFHSLEDRIVKRFLREHMELPFRKPLRSGQTECRVNPRARSARLRCGIKAQSAAA